MANALGYPNTAPPGMPYTTDRVKDLRSAAFSIATDPANSHINRPADADELKNIASPRRWVGPLAFRCLAIALKRDIIMINGSPRGDEVWTSVFYQSAEWRCTKQRSAIFETCTNIAAIKDWINGGEPLSPNSPKVDSYLVIHAQNTLRIRYFGRRASRDTPANARCPPAAESAKCQAQRALQSESVREAFRAKFPGDTMDKAFWREAWERLRDGGDCGHAGSASLARATWKPARPLLLSPRPPLPCAGVRR